MDRIDTIVFETPKSHTVADIGCDHGLISYKLLKSGKCNKVVFSDISEKCLQKAKNLLSAYIERDVAFPFLCDGIPKTDFPCDTAIIAGMGGEEIIGILKRASYKPDFLVLQPMKNLPSVRVFAVESGYRILRDFVFTDKDRYYDLIILKRGKDEISQEEIEFGRDNVVNRSCAFIKRCKERKELLKSLLDKGRLGEKTKSDVYDELRRLEKYV